MTTPNPNSGAGRHLKLSVVLLGACGLLAVYLPSIALTVETWSSNPYAGHGLFVPLFCALLLWWDRDRLLGLRADPQPLRGLLALAVALAILVVGRLEHNLALQLLSLVLALFSVLIYRLGTANLRPFAFPLFFLLLMHPLPDVAVAAISPPVRLFAAEFTSGSLSLLGVPHYQNGLLIRLPNITLEVAEGCNGLRFLAALFTLTVVLAQVTQRTPSRKIILAAASVPLAILANAIRVTAVTVGAYYIGPWIAADLPHHSIGKVVWILALLPLGLLAYLLRRRTDGVPASSKEQSLPVFASRSETSETLDVAKQDVGEERADPTKSAGRSRIAVRTDEKGLGRAMERSPISVLYFTNAVARGGAEEHILTLLRGLDRRLFRLHLACPPEVAEMLQPDVPADVELIPLHLGKPTQVGEARRLARIIRERQIDILHSHLFYSSLFASPIGWLCRVPLILETPHIRESWRRGFIKSRFVVDRFAGRFVDYFIAVSEANARYLIGQKRLPATKVVVIQNGCDLARFRPRPIERNGLRTSLGFDQGDSVLTIVGRLEPQKGHGVLLEAMPAILKKHPSARLVCVGEGSLQQALAAQVRALGLESTVRFVGYQPNVEDWLAVADVVVLPSFYEGLPLAAMESLAAGRPVVATAVDGTPEIIVDGKTGLTVPAGDVTALSQAIDRLLSEPESRRRLSDAGRKWVESRFSHWQQVRRTQELYLKGLAKRLDTKTTVEELPEELDELEDKEFVAQPESVKAIEERAS